VTAGEGNLLENGVPTIYRLWGGRNFELSITRPIYVHLANNA